MRQRTRIVLGILCCLHVSCGAGTGGREPAEEMAEVMAEFARLDIFSGTVLVGRGGKIVYAAAFGEANGYIRLVVTRGQGGLGLDPGRCEKPNLFLIADRLDLAEESQRENGIRLITASIRRPGPCVLDPRIKSLNYLNNILAKLEARHAGADEALLLNERGHVAEGTAENIFIARSEALFTPPVSDGALDGINPTKATFGDGDSDNDFELRNPREILIKSLYDMTYNPYSTNANTALNAKRDLFRFALQLMTGTPEFNVQK